MLRGTDWLRPWWSERQDDPESPDFVPGRVANLTHRSWTVLGNLASHRRAVVDPRGLVTPLRRGWSLDWWVGAEDRWHLPSREVAVRQRLVSGTPVVETAMRVPGGDVVHRVAAARAAGRDGGEHVVVEIENASPVPVALALALRPADPLGPVVVGSVGFDGTTVSVDGEPAVLFERPPARAVAGTAATGDVVHRVVEGPDEGWTGTVTCPEGRAHAAFVFPLAHAATLRAVLPLDPGAPGRAFPAVPAVSRVAAGWEAQTRRGMRAELPDPRLVRAFDAARRALLLAHGGEDVVTWPPRAVGWSDAAVVLGALDHLGCHAEVDEVLSGLPDRQRLDGAVLGEDGRLDAAGAALHAVGQHWALTRDAGLPEALVGPVAKAVHWIGRRCRSRRHRTDPATVGLLPDGTQPAWVGATGTSYHDAWWSIAGLRAVAAALDATGQPEVAADARGIAEDLCNAVASALATDAARLGTPVPPWGPGRGLDGALVANLAAVTLGVLAADDPRAVAVTEAVRSRVTALGLVTRAVDGAGLDPRLSLDLATVELRRGDRAALDRLARLLEVASPTGAWPSVLHPRTGGGSAGEGHDLVVGAAFCTFVRRLLVDERPGGVALACLVPTGWLGQGWEVHGAPTEAGTVSYAVRWHGERPALLWELEPARTGDPPPVRVTAPGLDPGWSSHELRGEALLAPVVPPAGASSGPG
jgi:hypothetical protein